MRCLHVFASIVVCGSALLPAETLRFRGTIGQRAVVVTVDADADSITSASYRYDRESSDVELVSHRLFGATVVLADEDGNVFHLHLQRADGSGAYELPHADKLDGTMDRDDLELPVALVRDAVKPH